MKVSIFIFLLCLLGEKAFSQKNKTTLPSPHGVVWLKDSLFIDFTEITNITWLQYLFFIKDSTEQKRLQALPDDTLMWDRRKYDPKVSDYSLEAVFSSHPVVGISYEQAVAFCQWRTEAINQTSEKWEKEGKGLLKGYQTRFYFRLPTEQEWEEAAQGGMFKVQNEYGLSKKAEKWLKKNKKIANIKGNYLVREKRRFREYDSLTNSVYEGLPNPLGLCDMIGNVSEMVLEKGIAKGGSWLNTLEECKISNRQYYDKPKKWLGFRCICEVKFTKIK